MVGSGMLGFPFRGTRRGRGCPCRDAAIRRIRRGGRWPGHACARLPARTGMRTDAAANKKAAMPAEQGWRLGSGGFFGGLPTRQVRYRPVARTAWAGESKQRGIRNLNSLRANVSEGFGFGNWVCQRLVATQHVRVGVRVEARPIPTRYLRARARFPGLRQHGSAP